MGETIVLPKSGVVLPQHPSCNYPRFFDRLGRFEFVIENTAPATSERWDAYAYAIDIYGARGLIEVFHGSREGAEHAIDARVLETRAALTPPWHVVVGPDARERIAEVVHGWSKNDLTIQSEREAFAKAVLRALGVRGGA